MWLVAPVLVVAVQLPLASSYSFCRFASKPLFAMVGSSHHMLVWRQSRNLNFSATRFQSSTDQPEDVLGNLSVLTESANESPDLEGAIAGGHAGLLADLAFLDLTWLFLF